MLKTDEGWPALRVSQALDVSQGTVFNVKRRFAEGGLDGVLNDRVQAHRYRKMDDRGGKPLKAHKAALGAKGGDHR